MSFNVRNKLKFAKISSMEKLILARKYARERSSRKIVSFEEQLMSKGKYSLPNFFLPFSFPFSRPFFSRFLLVCILFLAAVKSWVLIIANYGQSLEIGPYVSSVLVYRFTRASTKDQTIHNS